MPEYCDMITFYFTRQRLGICVSAKTDTQATLKDIAANGVFYTDYTEAI
jgi:hypothetical protein